LPNFTLSKAAGERIHATIKLAVAQALVAQSECDGVGRSFDRFAKYRVHIRWTIREATHHPVSVVQFVPNAHV
jgi:hypothetical protein